MRLNDPRRPEILAPVGDSECLRAAVQAGADAVYFGLRGFNARARATNFSDDSLSSTFEYLHRHGCRGYVTLNTLVFENELRDMQKAIEQCAMAGADAVIVQDLGVAKLVKQIAPTMPVHASTQMTCTDAGSVEFARTLGAKRVILARELSLEDIRNIRENTTMELEVFVHGALCIAYSGQCLTSEAIGGRSANRGACAQACRLPYELVVDGIKRDLGDKAYLLSPKDLDASAVIPELIQLGISSLKIEGRLKGPDYVAATTAWYRRLVDGLAQSTDGSLHEEALQAFSRGSDTGFFQGVDHQHLVDGHTCDHRGVLLGKTKSIKKRDNKTVLEVTLEADLARGDGVLVEGHFASEGEVGGKVWTLRAGHQDKELAKKGENVFIWLGPDKVVPTDLQGHRLFRTSAPRLSHHTLQRIAKEPKKQRIDVTITGELGKPFVLQAVTERGACAEVTSENSLELARTAPTTSDVLRDKLGRLGDSSYELGTLDVRLPEQVIIPVSALNRARRELVSALDLVANAPHKIESVECSALLSAAQVPNTNAKSGLFVLCRTLAQAQAAVDAGVDGVYLDFLELTGTGNAVRALRQMGPVHITLAPPRIRKPGEEKIDKFLLSLQPDALLVRGLGSLYEQQAVPSVIERIGDFSLNVTNRLSAVEVLSHGLSAFTPSYDLDSTQLVEFLKPDLAAAAEVVIHQPMPLFYMEHCVIAALLSEGKDHLTCGRPCEKHKVSLQDRAGLLHPVEADVGCRNTVFHAAAQSAAHLVAELQQAGVKRYRVELVREEPREVSRIVRAYRDLLAQTRTATEVWRELKTGGGYGVVKGSLRVIQG